MTASSHSAATAEGDGPTEPRPEIEAPVFPEAGFSEERIVVIGGGLSGLATAHSIGELTNARWRPVPRITLLEASSRIGGKVQTSREGGFTCEWGPAGFLDRESRTLDLCRHVDLDPVRASAAASKRYIYIDGALQEVPDSPLAFARSPLLSPAGKARLALEPFAPPRAALARDETIAEFARRRIGDEAFRTLIDTMQSGIHAGDPEKLSVRACFPRVVEVEQQYGSLIWGMIQVMRQRRQQRKRGDPLPGSPSGTLTSFAGGLQQLVDRLVERFPGKIRRDSPVRKVEHGADGLYRVVTESGDALDAEVVVVACPAYDGERIFAAGLDDRIAAVMGEIPYAPMVVVCLGFPREAVGHALDGFGFLAPRQQGLRLLGALFSSTIFSGRAPNGQVLIRAMIGGMRDSAVLAVDDSTLLASVCDEIGPLLGITAAPTMSRIFRHEQAIPQYNIGHRERRARVEACLHQHPGLFVTGNAWRGIGVNDCVANAWPLAEDIVRYLDDRAPGRSIPEIR